MNKTTEQRAKEHADLIHFNTSQVIVAEHLGSYALIGDDVKSQLETAYLAGSTEAGNSVSAIFKEPCKTCNDTGQVWRTDPTMAYSLCPDCSGYHFAGPPIPTAHITGVVMTEDDLRQLWQAGQNYGIEEERSQGFAYKMKSPDFNEYIKRLKR